MCFFGSGGTHLAEVSLILAAVGVLWNLTSSQQPRRNEYIHHIF